MNPGVEAFQVVEEQKTVARSPRKCWKKGLIYISNNLISALIVGPLTVFYWRGTWALLDVYCLPDNPAASGWVCVSVANIGLIALVYAQDILGRLLRMDNVVHWLIGFHLYTYVLGGFNVLQWRGVWVLLNHYTGVEFISAAVTYLIGQLGLWLLRASANVIAPPMLVSYDRNPEMFGYSTRFRVQAGDRVKYLLDTLLTVCVIHQLVVFYWRGVWALLDVHLFPDDVRMSAVVSLATSCVLHVVLVVIQPLANNLYVRSRNSALARWALETAVYFVASFICVTHWRGVWYLLDIYLLPTDRGLSAGLSHVIGIAGLWVLMCAHSVTLSGCVIEGQSPDDIGCYVPNMYIGRVTWQCCRVQKQSSTVVPKQESTDPTCESSQQAESQNKRFIP